MPRRFGQHFLKSKKLLDQIASYARIRSSDIVLEIGSAYGNLTEYLTKAKKVYAVEIDKKIFPELVENMKEHKNVECINMDVLDFKFPKDINKIVGNLPYEISSPITEKILEFLNIQKIEKKKDVLAILMYQKEFAERMIAFPGLKSYSRLSVLVNFYAEAEVLKQVPRTSFRPAPKVESSIVKLTPFGVDENRELLDLARALFTHKNSNVIKALISARDMLKIKDKKKLKTILPELLEAFKDKKVFYLEIEDMEDIQELLKSKKVI